ncbi:MAG: DUF4350 domain-containing protein [Burkholderiaceae bacterium]
MTATGHGAIGAAAIAWFVGWLVALAVLLAAGARLPLQAPGQGVRSAMIERLRGAAWQVLVVVTALATAILANIALVLHDAQIDLTREKTFTPSARALAVVDGLVRPLTLTYFIRGQDPSAQRMRTVLVAMARRNPLLTVRVIDPDRDPAQARAAGLRAANAAVLEADGRRLQIETTDENQLAIGIQRVLRREVVSICFVEGHDELPMHNEEFHTHVDGVAGHSHDDAASAIVQTTGHGIGRLRRALEAQGYETQRIVLVTVPRIPSACRVAVLASPRTGLLPAEVDAIGRWLEGGGSLLAMIDLGYAPTVELRRLLGGLGVALPQQVVIDPLSHYATDAAMVAVTAYEPSPITRNLSMTFFPGARPLRLLPAGPGLTVVPLVRSSRDSYVRAVEGTDAALPEGEGDGNGQESAPRSAADAAPAVLADAPASRLLAVSVERPATAGGDGPGFRAVVVGDGDFASNSFLPYLANSDLALAMVRWLAREERVAVVPTRIPVPPMIALTQGQMKTIFVAVEMALPLAVVLLGGFVWWRRR